MNSWMFGRSQNGYDTSLCGEHPLLIGGGAGVPPMFLLAKQLISEGKIPMVIAGFNTFDECFFEDEFKKIGARIIIATADGSCGGKGLLPMQCAVLMPKAMTASLLTLITVRAGRSRC